MRSIKAKIKSSSPASEKLFVVTKMTKQIIYKPTSQLKITCHLTSLTKNYPFKFTAFSINSQLHSNITNDFV